MVTNGAAIGGGDAFGGQSYMGWNIAYQDMTAGGHGATVINWITTSVWAPGDNCHTLKDGAGYVNGSQVWSAPGVFHAFSGGHVHTDIWPGGGWASAQFAIFHDASGNATLTLDVTQTGSSGPASVGHDSWALPQIPQSPASPSAASAARVSDTQASVSWTNNSTGTAPYASVKVYRRTDGGGWALIATLGVVTSYSDTTIAANHKYEYRMSAVGANGVEVGYATTTAIYTTPAVPSTPTATKQMNGDIVVAWSNGVGYTEHLIEIQESTNGGSSWANLNTSIASGSTSYTHTAPSTGVTHTYRVRTKTSSGTTLFSAYTAASNTVTLLATANPPTNLAPSGAARDATGAIVLTWTHNPADGTPQSKYQLQYKVDGGAFTTVGPTTSGTSSYTLTGGTLTNGHTITWHVATAGQNGTLSSYSADSTFVTSAAPTVNITTPGASWNSSHITAEWTYFQAQSSPQASWVAALLTAGGAELEAQSGSGTTDDVSFGYTLLDGVSYQVRVTVTSAAGLASAPDVQSFTVTYLPPADVHVTATYDAGSGSMVLTVTADDPVPGVTVAVASVSIERSIDTGPWVTIASGLALHPVGVTPTVIVLDLTATIHGTNVYRAVALSALPSSVVSDEEEAITAEGYWSFLSGGPGFARVLRFRDAPSFKADSGRQKALHHFAGREKPVELAGEATDLAVSVSGLLRRGASTPEEFEAMGKIKGVVLWREPTGRRMFASLGTVSTDRRNHLIATVSFDVTETDYTE